MAEGAGGDDYKVVKFQGKKDEDFMLWSLRMETALEAKDLFDAVKSAETSSITTTQDVDTRSSEQGAAGASERSESSQKCRKAAAFIMGALGDKPLRAVASARKNPALIWKRLHERYASDSTSNKVSLQGTLMKKRYPRNGDMLQYVSEFESLFDQLENMNEKIGESMRVAILFNSLSEAKDYEGVITALRTISEEMTWDKATTRLIEEWERKDSSRKTEKPETKAFYAQTKKSKTLKCWNCDKKGHIAANCRSKKAKSDSDDDTDTDGKKDSKKGRKMQKNSENAGKPRAAVVISAFAGESWHDYGSEESFIVDSGASWHMCKAKDLFHDMRPIPERDIVLGNNSTSACKEY
jgi:hypothetical protein